MDRIAWLNKWADFYLEYGHFPHLPLPHHGDYDGCEMVMVSRSNERWDMLDFSAHFGDSILLVFRPAPVRKSNGPTSV